LGCLQWSKRIEESRKSRNKRDLGLVQFYYCDGRETVSSDKKVVVSYKLRKYYANINLMIDGMLDATTNVNEEIQS